VVAVHDGRFAGAAKVKRFDDVLAAVDDAVAIGVDIPIGLLPESMRVCDALARKYVGARRASVFLTPPRKALEADTYEEANALCRMLTERGLSKQAYGLRSKIFEVERALQEEERARTDADRLPLTAKPERHPARVAAERVESRESLRKYARIIEPDGGRRRKADDALPGGRVVEVHPECSFRLMNDGELSHAKKTYNGMMKRKELLEEAGISIPIELEEIGGVAVDDVFDAAAAAWTAHRYAIGKARSLPPRELWQHDGKRAIAIWI
jgi:predicted RNase H-like nuclease